MNNELGVRRGRELAQVVTVERIGRLWRVPAASSEYWVDPERGSCTCPEFEITARPCKHVHCVYYAIASGRARAANDEQPVVLPGVVLHERDVFEQLLRDLCAGIVEPGAAPGERSDARRSVVRSAIESRAFSGHMKSKSIRVAGSQSTEFARLHSIFDFFSDETSTPLLRALLSESVTPLHLVEDARVWIDSGSAATVTYERWFDQRDGRWLRLRLAMGTSTHGVVSSKLTTETTCPLIPTSTEARADGEIEVWSPDVLESFGVTPYIPLNDNAVVSPRPDAWSRCLGAFLFDRQRFVSRYRPRSTVEETISLLKLKLGTALSSRHPIAPLNEVLARAIAHNVRAVTNAIFAAGLASRISPGTPLLKVVR